MSQLLECPACLKIEKAPVSQCSRCGEPISESFHDVSVQSEDLGPGEIYCPHCKYQGKGKRRGSQVNIPLFIFLTLLGVIPGLIYLNLNSMGANKRVCPECSNPMVILSSRYGLVTKLLFIAMFTIFFWGFYMAIPIK